MPQTKSQKLHQKETSAKKGGEGGETTLKISVQLRQMDNETQKKKNRSKEKIIINK